MKFFLEILRNDNTPSSRMTLGSALSFDNANENTSKVKLGKRQSLPNLFHQWHGIFFATANDSNADKAKKTANRSFALAVVLTGVAGIGKLISPGLILLTIPGFLYISRPILLRAYKLARQGRVNIDTLLSVKILIAFATNFIFSMGLTYILFYAGEKLMLLVKNSSSENFIDVFNQYPRFAWLQAEEGAVQVEVEYLKAGDIVLCETGETIPVDGIVVAGIGSVDQHILTGEAQLAEKEIGDRVFASTVVLSGRISICVEKAGDETTVARIGHILNDTVDFKSNTQLRAEKMADRTVAPTLLLSTFCLATMGPSAALAIMQSHFSARMSIVAPVSILSYFNLMSENGLLIKDGRTLDLLNEVDTIVFDKTGTLTQEQPHVGQIFCCSQQEERGVIDNGYRENEVVRFAVAAEQNQNHPIARAIIAEAAQRQLCVPVIDDAEYKLGYGLSVVLDGQLVRVGSKRFIDLAGIAVPPLIEEAQSSCHEQGHSLVLVALDNELIGALELIPTVRPEANRIIKQLQQRKNIQAMYIISGDHTTPTKKLAQELGIEHYFAETLPENKAELIEQLQAQGRSVCFIGDGINDSIALKKANVSISLKGASTIAQDSAQIILMDESLNKLDQLFDIAQDFHKNIDNGFNALLIPAIIGMAGAVFLNFGFMPAVILSQLGLVIGTLNGMQPRLSASNTSRHIGVEYVKEDETHQAIVNKQGYSEFRSTPEND